MVYINPIEILELKDKEVNEIDSSVIKKSKRRLFAEIDLSDGGFYEYNGQKLTKSDCERAIEELEDKNKLEFYSHLSTNLELNNFLGNGSNDLINKLKQESIYKLPEFVDFISPFFSAKIDHILLRSFQNNDLELFSSALRSEYLISKKDLNKAYKSLSNEIQQRITETDKLTKEIKEDESNYSEDNIAEVVKIIKTRFPNEFLNKLPVYFQSQINKIAASINFLQLNIWNGFNATAVPLSLLEYLLELNIESVSKPTFEKNYKIVKKKHEERLNQEKNAPIIKRWAELLITIKTLILALENGEEINPQATVYSHGKIQEKEYWNPQNFYDAISEKFKLKRFFDGTAEYGDLMIRSGPDQQKSWILEKERQRNLGESKESILYLNELPDFADEIRNQFALTLRSSSILIWNKFSNIKISLALIDLALTINSTEDVKSSILNDKVEFKEFEKKYEGVLVCHFCETNAPDKGCEINKTIYKETSRTSFPTRGVKFTYSEITIPRCKSCKETHSEGSKKHVFIILGGLILGALIGAANEEHYIIGGIIGLISGFIGSAISTALIDNPKIKQKGIKVDNNSTLKKHPLLIERFKDGWTFDKPTA